ncbi:MAG: peptide-methionine (S)-S-oxide reductase MsrA [Bryobacteraceae bacterium]|nr:peptide-methionine (S)-S-oxide reductase MsrA [Bryobacteraceae bacterium]
MRETATLGGGCFWCLEAVFDEVLGVGDVVSGYTGGGNPNPTYEQVCGGRTGHAEVVRVEFDPEVISFAEILEIFFAIHDPTTLNRQGNDVGTQYRSAIFYHSPQQKKTAEEMIARLNAEGVWLSRIVTEVTPAPEFFAAEEYHQNYFVNHPEQGYCSFVVSPKVSKFRKYFSSKRKAAKIT